MNSPSLFNGLAARLEELEQRVARLEQQRHVHEAEAEANAVQASEAILAPPATQLSGFLATAGKALLGIAGAYLLRALADSHTVAAILLAPLAILYALAWLVVAARSGQSAARLIYSGTSVLILAPMLWELTLRFQVLPAWADALALLATAGLAFGLCRSADNFAVLRFNHVAVAVLALVLAVVTRNTLPFLGVLLCLNAVYELSALRKAGFTRGIVAIAADLGVWLLLYIYRSEHRDYAELPVFWLVAPGFLLSAIAATGVGLTAIVRRETLTLFTALQAPVSFLLACAGWLYFGPATRLPVLGAICLALAAALYAALLTRLRGPADWRGFAVFATWSAALLLAGSYLLFPPHWRSGWLGLSAVAVGSIGARTGMTFLGIHTNILLVVMAVESGLAVYAWQTFTAMPGTAPGLEIWLALLGAVACYAALQPTGKFRQSLSFVSILISAVALAALFVAGVVMFAAVESAAHPAQIALLRSFALCAIAVLLAFGGAVWRRKELLHIAYLFVIVEALKLLAEDLRHGQMVFIAGSVCLYALTLIALPRLAKRASTSS